MSLPHILLSLFLIVTFDVSKGLKVKILDHFDLKNPFEKEFFTKTVPWIVDNLGLDLTLDFHFLDSPRLMGPRKCALKALEDNIWLQVEYLTCEASGKSNTECRQQLNINQECYYHCLRRKVKGFAKQAQSEYKKLRTDKKTPLIVLLRNKFAEYKDPKDALESVCSLFGRRRPDGCNNPTAIDEDATTTPSAPQTTEVTATTGDSVPTSNPTSTTGTTKATTSTENVAISTEDDVTSTTETTEKQATRDYD